MAFTDTVVTDNAMPDRDILEDGSKVFICKPNRIFRAYKSSKYYTNGITDIEFHGSGRLQALWLCGYENIKTIYTHFDEPVLSQKKKKTIQIKPIINTSKKKF